MKNFNELLDASRLGQTCGIPGAGSPLLIESVPGLGKTARVGAYCDAVNHLLVTVILGRLPNVDIGGMKVPNFDTGELVTMISHRLLGDIPGAENYDGVCIFLDEIGATLEDQQTAIQSFIEDRELEGHQLPDNVWFVCATNPADANCGSNELVRSLLDRVVIKRITDAEIEEDIFPDWLTWAEGGSTTVDAGKVTWSVEPSLWPAGIHPFIPAFLRWSKSDGEGGRFHSYDPDSADRAQPSARAWTKLSTYLYQHLTPSTLRVLGEGLVGRAVYTEFAGFIRLGGDLPTVDEIFDNPSTAKVPSGEVAISGTFAVISNVCGELRSRRGKRLPTEVVDAVITYLRRLDAAYAVYGFRQATRSHDDFARASSEFSQFLKDHQDLVI